MRVKKIRVKKNFWVKKNFGEWKNFKVWKKLGFEKIFGLSHFAVFKFNPPSQLEKYSANSIWEFFFDRRFPRSSKVWATNIDCVSLREIRLLSSHTLFLKQCQILKGPTKRHILICCAIINWDFSAKVIWYVNHKISVENQRELFSQIELVNWMFSFLRRKKWLNERTAIIALWKASRFVDSRAENLLSTYPTTSVIYWTILLPPRRLFERKLSLKRRTIWN